MKTFAILLMSCLLFVSCSKKDSLNEEKHGEGGQEVFGQEMLAQEVEKSKVFYLFDIESFKFIDEFPSTIDGIKALYPSENFEEDTIEHSVKGYLGKYAYTLKSPNIRFSFIGDTMEEAYLQIVVILNAEYQCKVMQIIGMSTEELENVSSKKLTRDKTIAIYSEKDDGLIIETQDGIVQSYTILRAM